MIDSIEVATNFVFSLFMPDKIEVQDESLSQ